MNLADRRVVRWRSKDGARTALYLGEGRKFIHLLPMDYPLQVTRIPLTDGRYLRDMDVPLSKALRQFRRAAVQWHGRISNCSDQVQLALKQENTHD